MDSFLVLSAIAVVCLALVRPYRRARLITARSSDTAAHFVTKCATLHRPPSYFTFPFFSNPHVNTIAGALRPSPRVAYVREAFPSPHDGGTVTLDCCHRMPSTTPLGTILICPGLASHSDSSYIKHFVREAASCGWDVIVLNARGTGDTPLTTPQMFSAGWTTDIRDVVGHLRSSRGPKGSHVIVGVGFSLGANYLVKFMGEEGVDCALDAGVSVCNPWDLLESSRFFYRSRVCQALYTPSFTEGLTSYFRRHAAVLGRPGIDAEAVLGSRTVRDFDEHFVVPAMGYMSVDHYYEACSAIHYVRTVGIPLFVLDSTDDPVVGCIISDKQWQAIVEHRPNVYVVRVHGGGHIGFQDARTTLSYLRTGTSSWGDRVVCRILGEFCAHMGQR